MEVYFILILLILVGLVIGSFVSVVSYRLPKNITFIKGRSFCDLCRKQLKWYDNIPLFSYFFYFGKSRCCKRKISIRYPLIELVSAFGLIFLYFIFGFSFLLATYYILLVLTLSILIIDIEHQIIPDELSWLVLLLGLINFSFQNVFSAFLFSLIFLIIYLSTQGRGMGLGDVKLAIPLGFILGLEKGLYWLLVSFILGGIVASLLLILKKAKLKTKIAFGPFMIIAFWIVLMI